MKCDIKGVEIRELTRYEDQRGWLIELFRHDEMDEQFYPAMSYVSMTRPGVARGPHEHEDQADFFCFVGPSTFKLYLWDNRKESPTYGKKFTVEGGENQPLAVIVPIGVVHAYKNIGSTDGIVYNSPNRLFMGENKKSPVDEIRHEDDPDTPYRLDD